VRRLIPLLIKESDRGDVYPSPYQGEGQGRGLRFTPLFTKERGRGEVLIHLS